MANIIDTTNIDITKPASGAATTQSVRDNFSAIKTELDKLSSSTTAIELPYCDIGDPGLETSGINVNGTTYDAGLRINDIGTNKIAQVVVHRHSTTLQPLILGARANSETSSHSAVTAGQSLFSLFGAGYTGTNYDLFAEIVMQASSSGSISSSSSPGKIVLSTTPNGSNTPAPVLTLDQDKSSTFAGTLVAINGGSLTGTWSDLGTVTTVDVNGGTIDGVPIGATTPSSAEFTSLKTPDNLKTQRTIINFASDANYTLSTTENNYSQIEMTDTGVVLTTAREVIIDTTPKLFSFINSTAQTLTVKTLSGSGAVIRPANISVIYELYSDGTNVVVVGGDSLIDYTDVTGAATTSITFSNIDINTYKSYKIELEYINAGTAATVYLYYNGDTTLTNYYNQSILSSGTGTTNNRSNTADVLYASASSISKADISINIIGGYANCLSKTLRNLGSTIEQQDFSQAKTNTTVSNITSITLSTSVATQFAIGTKARIYR